MSEHLEIVRQELETGQVSARSRGRHFSEGGEAAHRGDLAALERTLDLATRTAQAADASLAVEAQRLIALCEDLLGRLRAATGEEPCPGCGRPVATSAVRCRSCGTLLV
jgi:hypothetical protein